MQAIQEMIRAAWALLVKAENTDCNDDSAASRGDGVKREDGECPEDVLTNTEDELSDIEEEQAPRWRAPWAWNSEDDLSDTEVILSETEEEEEQAPRWRAPWAWNSEDDLSDTEVILSETEEEEEQAPRWRAPWAWNSEDDLSDTEVIVSKAEEEQAPGGRAPWAWDRVKDLSDSEDALVKQDGMAAAQQESNTTESSAGKSECENESAGLKTDTGKKENDECTEDALTNTEDDLRHTKDAILTQDYLTEVEQENNITETSVEKSDESEKLKAVSGKLRVKNGKKCSKMQASEQFSCTVQVSGSMKKPTEILVLAQQPWRCLGWMKTFVPVATITMAEDKWQRIPNKNKWENVEAEIHANFKKLAAMNGDGRRVKVKVKVGKRTHFKRVFHNSNIFDIVDGSDFTMEEDQSVLTVMKDLLECFILKRGQHQHVPDNRQGGDGVASGNV